MLRPTPLHNAVSGPPRMACGSVWFRVLGRHLFGGDLAQPCPHTTSLYKASTPSRGTLRTAFRTGFQLFAVCASPRDELRGWKLFPLAPRMHLQRDVGHLQHGAKSSRAANGLASCSKPLQVLPGRPPGAQRLRTSTARAGRAIALVHLSELSARALVADPLAPGSAATLAELRDFAPRPAERYTAPCRPTWPLLSPVSRVRSRSMPSSHACGRRDADQQLARREPS